MAPVLEQRAAGAGIGQQQPGVVGAETTERDDELGAGQHVDGIELDGAQLARQSGDVGQSRPAARARAVQPLGLQRQPDGLPGREAGRHEGGC